MRFNLLKTSVFILILLSLGFFLFYKIDFFSLSVNDLGRHIKNGQMLFGGARDVLTTNFYSYTEPDFPFINHHWLSGVIFYLLHQAFGFGGLVIFKMVILSFVFTLLFLVSIKKSDFWVAALFSLPAILILKERTELRPEIFSYLFIAFFLYFLINFEKHPEEKKVFWLIPLQLLWINLHSFFFLGILIAAGFLLEKIILNIKNFKNNPLIKKLIFLVIALMIVSFINPSGIRGVLLPLNISENYGYEVSENQSLFWAQENYWWDVPIRIFMPMLVFLALSFVLALASRKKPIFYFLGSAAAAAAAFFLIRAIPLFGLFFLPAVSFNCTGIFLKLKEHLREKWPAETAILGKVLIFALACVFIYTVFAVRKTEISTGAVAREWGAGLFEGANASAAFFKEQGLKGPIFNNYDIGSYLIYHFFPQERVFIDNRPEAYPSSFFKDVYYPMMEDEEKWREFQEKYNFNVIFFDQNWGDREGSFLMRRLSDDQSWFLVYTDAYAIILLKNNPENQETIEKFKITPENISERISRLQESDKLNERVAAVNLFILYGQYDSAMAALQKIVDEWPKYSQGWLTMGTLEGVEDNLTSLNLSIVFIEKAISLGEKTSEAYTLLGLNSFRSGQFEKADKALRKALEINSDRQDAKEYLKQLQQYLKK